MVASRDVRVEIKQPVDKKPGDAADAPKFTTIRAQMETLDAYPLPDVQTAMLLAGEKGDVPVKIVTGDNTIEGNRIQMDGKSKTFRVVGPGKFFMTAIDKTDPKAKPTPIVITWTREMIYDDLTRRPSFMATPVFRRMRPGSLSGTLTRHRTSAD